MVWMVNMVGSVPPHGRRSIPSEGIELPPPRSYSPRMIASPVGTLMRHWRRERRMSQLGLAREAGTTQRHVSFVESGRASPAARWSCALARALDVPLRERNQLLLAAGYAPHYRETGLDAAAMAQVQAALDRMLAQQEPYPAVVMDRHWNMLRTNDAAARCSGSCSTARSPSRPMSCG